MRNAASQHSDTTDQDTVLKSTLLATVAALLLISTLFITAFASIEAVASPVHHGGDARSMVSVRYLA